MFASEAKLGSINRFAASAVPGVLAIVFCYPLLENSGVTRYVEDMNAGIAIAAAVSVAWLLGEIAFGLGSVLLQLAQMKQFKKYLKIKFPDENIAEVDRFQFSRALDERVFDRVGTASLAPFVSRSVYLHLSHLYRPAVMMTDQEQAAIVTQAMCKCAKISPETDETFRLKAISGVEIVALVAALIYLLDVFVGYTGRPLVAMGLLILLGLLLDKISAYGLRQYFTQVSAKCWVELVDSDASVANFLDHLNSENVDLLGNGEPSQPECNKAIKDEKSK